MLILKIELNAHFIGLNCFRIQDNLRNCYTLQPFQFIRMYSSVAIADIFISDISMILAILLWRRPIYASNWNDNKV